MAHSISITGTVPLTGDMVADARTTLALAEAFVTFTEAVTSVNGTIAMERGYTGPAEAKKERKPRAKKVAPDAA